MTQHRHATFATTPLITPERLQADPALIEGDRPAWAHLVALADPEAPLADSKAAVHVLSAPLTDRPSPHQPGSDIGALFHFPTISLAILYELTRCGGSCVPNTNKKRTAKGATARWYLKHMPYGAPGDGMTVQRLIADARAHQAVNLGEDPRDLHPASLSLSGAGKPTKDARAVAIGHAKTAAQAFGLSETEVEAYLANLHALFALHDDLLLVGAV